MPRSPRTWADLKPDVYELLREEEDTSFWSAGLLRQLFNDRMEFWTLRLADLDEGWITEIYQDDLVADQAFYTIPEGVDRIKHVCLRYDEGGNETITPLTRVERIAGSTHHTSSGGGVPGRSYLPSYRLVGELIELNPRPTEGRTNGLHIELEALPERLIGDSSKLPLKFPISMETLLVIDTACAALAVEDSQGNLGGSQQTYKNHLLRMRDEHAEAFMAIASRRTLGRSFGPRLSRGD